MRALRLAPLLITVMAACRDEAQCIVPPCVAPLALTVSVVSATTKLPVAGATLRDAGASSTIPCNQGTGSECYVLGGAGAYAVQVSAPGFRAANWTGTVTGTHVACGCDRVDTRSVRIELQPE